MKKNTYMENGVVLSKASVKVGDEVELKYNGLLKNAGAQELKVHFGYNDTWEDPETLDMTLNEDCFTVQILLKKAGTLNCAFVDPAGNWDNNSGANYSFKVSAIRSKKDAGENSTSEKKRCSRAKKTSAEPAKAKKTTRKRRTEKAFDEAAVSATDELKSKPRSKKASKDIQEN